MVSEHFVLLLDVLGFKSLVRERSLTSICELIERSLLSECDQWTSHGPHVEFDTIHFSDTVILHTRDSGFSKEWYDDLCFIGSRVCCRLLAEKVPVRGAMAYGSFVRKKVRRHEVFVGEAVISAHEREQGGAHLGFSVDASVWRRLYGGGDAEAYLERAGEGLVLPDGDLWVNPLTEFADHDKGRLLSQLAEDFERPENGSGYLPTEILAFKFVDETAEAAVKSQQVLTPVEVKYLNTQNFFRRALGPDVFEFARELGLKE